MYQGSRFQPRSGASLQEIPVTWGLLGLNVLTFLLAFLGMRAGWGETLLRLLALTPESHLRPWSFLTWPLVAGQDLFGLLINCYITFQFGGSLERSWGQRAYGGFMAATSVLTGMTLWLGMLLLHAPMVEFSLWLPITAMVVAWAAINRRETIRFAFLIPLPALWMAIIGVVFAFFHVSMRGGHPLLGLFALSGCALAYLWVTKDSWAKPRKSKATANTRFVDFDREVKGTVKPPSNPFTRAAEEKKRRERDKKLEEMFRRSGYDDDGNRS